MKEDRDGVGDESIDFADVLIEGGADVDEAGRSWGGGEERQQCLFPFSQSCQLFWPLSILPNIHMVLILYFKSFAKKNNNKSFCSDSLVELL